MAGRRAAKAHAGRSTLVEKDGPAIVGEIIMKAKDGDAEGRREFLRYLLPHPKLARC
jgi:hypothetical protein